MIDSRRGESVLRTSDTSKSSLRAKRARAAVEISSSSRIASSKRKDGNIDTVAVDIRELASDRDRNSTVYRIANQSALRSVEKVIAAESNLKDAAISMGQQQKVGALLAELYDLATILASCSGDKAVAAIVPESRSVDELRPALPQWWFALSETVETVEREIDFLFSIAGGQPKRSPVRLHCGRVIRTLRKHYAVLLAEAEEWMSLADA